MKYSIAILVFTLASFASAIPLPQGLTEAEFRSLRDEETPRSKVDIFSGYAQVKCHSVAIIPILYALY